MKRTAPLMPGNRVPLYRQIAQTLRRRVRTGVYTAGAFLPAVRTLSAEFGVGSNAVQKAIYELEQDKVVVTQHGRGTRVMQEEPCDQAAILFGLIEPYAGEMAFESRIVRTAEKVFSRRNDFLVTRSSEGDAGQERAVAEHFVRNGIKGIMVWPVENDPNGPFFAELARTVPVVVLDRALAGCELPSVLFDFEQAGGEACRQLLAVPSRQGGLLAVMDDLDIPPYHDFETGLRRAAAALGRAGELTIRRIPATRICQQVDQGDYALADVYQKKLGGWLAKERYDALFCFHDDVADHVLVETGVAARFPELRLGTVTASGTNNRSREFNRRPILRWRLDQPRMIAAAADLLQTWVYARAQPAAVPPIRLELLAPLHPQKPLPERRPGGHAVPESAFPGDVCSIEFICSRQQRSNVMKAKTILSCAAAGLMTVSSGWAAFLETNPVPGFNSTSGNPATDAHGNQWTVCQVAYTGVNDGGAWGSNLPTTGGWVPMTLSGSTYYGNHINYQSAPNVSGTSYFVERNWDTGVNYNAGLIFKPDVAGTYSWSGTISWNDWGNGGSNTNPLDVVFGKFDAGGTWSTLLTASVPTWFQGNLNVGTQLALQNIVLQAGDTLVVAGKAGASSDKGSWDLGSASINLVPEPASLALLALGGLALFRRRR